MRTVISIGLLVLALVTLLFGFLPALVEVFVALEEGSSVSQAVAVLAVWNILAASLLLAAAGVVVRDVGRIADAAAPRPEGGGGWWAQAAERRRQALRARRKRLGPRRH